jgi:hypothetical protein
VSLPPARSGGRRGHHGRAEPSPFGAPLAPPHGAPKNLLFAGQTSQIRRGAPFPWAPSRPELLDHARRVPPQRGPGSANENPPSGAQPVDGRARARRGPTSARAQNSGRQRDPAADDGCGRDCYAGARVSLPPARSGGAPGGSAGGPNGAPSEPLWSPLVEPAEVLHLQGKTGGSGRGTAFPFWAPHRRSRP